jgi:hypothetical protein
MKADIFRSGGKHLEALKRVLSALLAHGDGGICEAFPGERLIANAAPAATELCLT